MSFFVRKIVFFAGFVFFFGMAWKISPAYAVPGTLLIPSTAQSFTTTNIITTKLTLGGVDVTATAAELNRVVGVTSAIQTQFANIANSINLKAPIASPTFTGTVIAPTFSGALSGTATTATTATTANAVSFNGGLTTGSNPTFNSVYLADGNNRLYQGAGTSTHIQTAYGYMELGPQNASWAHIQTDRGAFYFNKQVTVDGNICFYSGGYCFYSDTGNSGWRTGNNFLVNGNIYWGTGGIWLDSWLNQSVKTNANPTFGTVYAALSGNATSATNADTVDGQHFAWSNNDNNPSYLWGANSNGSGFLAARGSMSVNYANSAGSTGTLTGSAHTNGSDGWFRSDGQSGWYNQTYAVGVYATQAGRVDLYNGASLYVPGQINSGGLSVEQMVWNGLNTGGTQFYVRGADVGGGSIGYLQIVLGGVTYGIPINFSSRTRKSNITNLEVDSSKIYNLRPVSFNANGAPAGTPRNFGLIAEEVNDVFPQLVTRDENKKIFGVDYTSLPVLILNEMQKTKLASDADLALIKNPGKIIISNSSQVTGSNGVLVTKVSAFAQSFIGKLKAGVIETKKLVVDGVDILGRLNEQQKQIDDLKKIVGELQKIKK